MYLKLPLLTTVCVSLLFSLSACPPAPLPDDSQARFDVTGTGQHGVSGYTPTGWGWKPNSKVEISIWDEPGGDGHWKKILDENVNADGMFGFEPGPAPFYPVEPKICGNGELDQTVVFMAKSLTTGKIEMDRVTAGFYFTHRPCP